MYSMLIKGTFTQEVNPRLAKRPLKTTSRQIGLKDLLLRLMYARKYCNLISQRAASFGISRENKSAMWESYINLYLVAKERPKKCHTYTHMYVSLYAHTIFGFLRLQFISPSPQYPLLKISSSSNRLSMWMGIMVAILYNAVQLHLHKAFVTPTDSHNSPESRGLINMI